MTMLFFLQALWITSLACNGIYLLTREDMPLHFINRALLRAPSWVRKPLFDCIVCMSPYYSLVFLFHAGIPSVTFLGIWAIFVLCLVGLNAVMSFFIA